MEAIEEEKTLPLRRPVTLGSETIYEISLREPTGDQYLAFQRRLNAPDGGAYAATLLLIEMVSGTNKALVGRMGVRDIREADRYLSLFFDDSPPTGKT